MTDSSGLPESPSSSSHSLPGSFDSLMMSSAIGSSVSAIHPSLLTAGLMDPAHFSIYQRFFHPPPRQFDLFSYHAAAIHQHLAIAAANRSLSNTPLFNGVPIPNSISGSTSGALTKKSSNSYNVADLLAENQPASTKSDQTFNSSPDDSGKL